MLEIDEMNMKTSNHYTKKEVTDTYKLKKMKKNMPSIITKVNEDLPEGSSLILAGGAIRSVFTNSEINDYDLYLLTDVTDNEAYGELLYNIVEQLANNGTFISCTDKSLLVSSSGILINFVFFKKFASIDDIFKSFDFTCVMGAFDVGSDKFYLSEEFLIDNIAKIIRFNHETSFPIMSLLRVKKYADKGYSISRNEMLKICLKISELKIDSFQVLKKHIGGMYGIDIDEIFDIEKPFDMNTVLNEISDLDVDFDSIIDHSADYTALHVLKINLCNDCNFTYYKHNNQILLIKSGVLQGVINDDILKKNNIMLKPHSGKFKVYKYVGYDGEKFYSQREKDFIYKLGERILPKTNSTGLFCGSLNRKKSFTFATDKGSMLIELLVDGKDIINISSYEYHSTRIGISNMEVKQFVFNKVIDSPKDE